MDLNRKELLRVEDYGVIPLPPQAGNWARRVHQGDAATGSSRWRSSQPEGPSFTVQGREVSWQKWTFRVGFNPREGLVLHTVAYDGRPVLYRASIAEMMVPYADPKASSYHKNVFDLGEYGVGMMANSLAIGCDCLGTIRYFDGHMADSRGRRRHHQERDLPARGRFRHALEAHRLAHRPVGGAPIAPAGRLDGRHGGQLRLWLLLVLVPGRHDPDGGQAHRDREHDRARSPASGPLRHRGRAASCSPPFISTISTPGSTSPSTARTTRIYEVNTRERAGRSR